MNKKRLILVIAAAVLLAAAITVPAVLHAKKTVSVDCAYPYSYVVGKDSVKVKIAGSGDWIAVHSETSGLTVKQNSARRFTVKAGDISTDSVSFLLSVPEGEHFITLTLSRDADGKLYAAHGAAVDREGEKEFCTDTQIPVKFIPGHDGNAEIIFPGAPTGLWETEAPEGLTVSSGYHDKEGRRYTVSAAAAGEYTIVVSDRLRGLTSTVVLSADDALTLSPVSVTAGTCQKLSQERVNEGPKEEPEETTEYYYYY